MLLKEDRRPAENGSAMCFCLFNQLDRWTLTLEEYWQFPVSGNVPETMPYVLYVVVKFPF